MERKQRKIFLIHFVMLYNFDLKKKKLRQHRQSRYGFPAPHRDRFTTRALRGQIDNICVAGDGQRILKRESFRDAEGRPVGICQKFLGGDLLPQSDKGIREEHPGRSRRRCGHGGNLRRDRFAVRRTPQKPVVKKAEKKIDDDDFDFEFIDLDDK